MDLRGHRYHSLGSPSCEVLMPDVCVILVATAGYPPLARRLILSAERHFAPGFEKHYLIFTDTPRECSLDLPPNAVTCAGVTHQEWPAMTLNRYEMITSEAAHLAGYDLLVYFDADMLFVRDVP